MASRRAISSINGRLTATPTSDYLTSTGDLYNGTTRYEASQTRRYTSSGTTDSNGRITFNMTADGTASGAALFTAIFHVSGFPRINAANAQNVPTFYIESISANLKQVTLRSISNGSVISILGINILQVTFGASGVTCYINVSGLP